MLTVIPHRHYRHESGRTASLYGASPWVNQSERVQWSTVESGYTWSDSSSGTIGLGRAPVATREDAEAIAAPINAARAAARAEADAMVAAIGHPVAWAKVPAGDSYCIDSGEGWQIKPVRSCGRTYGYTAHQSAEAPAWVEFRSLAKTKAYAARMIQGERRAAYAEGLTHA